MTDSVPFWDDAYRRGDRPFGGPSGEVVALMERLADPGRVLDLGSGDGRHAFPIALAGHVVTAVDVSEAAVEGLRRAAREAAADGRPLEITAIQADLAEYPVSGPYDLIIAHGVLHLLKPARRDALLDAMKTATAPGGWNVVASFTDEIPPPADLAPHCHGLFAPGELFDRYRDWEMELERAYVLEDEHPGGIRHRHPINKVVARKPE